MNIIVKFVKNYLKECSYASMEYAGITAEEICIRQMKKIKPTDEELHQHNTFTRVKGQPIKWEKISAQELISETHKDFLSLGNTHIGTKSIKKREKGLEWTFPQGKQYIWLINT